MFELCCNKLSAYSVQVVDGLLDPHQMSCSGLSGRRHLIVTTPTVGGLLLPQLLEYGRNHSLDLHLISITLDEQAKTIDAALGGLPPCANVGSPWAVGCPHCSGRRSLL